MRELYMSIKGKPSYFSSSKDIYNMIAITESGCTIITCSKSRKINAVIFTTSRNVLDEVLSKYNILDKFPDFSYKDEFIRAVFEDSK